MNQNPQEEQNDDSQPEHSEQERAKIIARLTWRYMLTIMGEGMKHTPLDPIDHMLALVICTANLSHIDSSPDLSREYADTIEPDTVRRGVSRGVIARALSMPAETVRRRLNALIKAEILAERADGLILRADNPLQIGARQELWQFHARQFERLLRELRLRGITFDERR